MGIPPFVVVEGRSTSGTMVLKLLTLLMAIAALGGATGDKSSVMEQQQQEDQKLGRKTSRMNTSRNKAGCDILGGVCTKAWDCPCGYSLENRADMPMRFFCKGPNRSKCCYPPTATRCPSGFYSVDSLNKCVMLGVDKPVSWERAKRICRKKGLDILQPDDPNTMKQFIKDNISELYFKILWLDGRGDGTNMVSSKGQIISNEDSNWGWGNDERDTEHCLYMHTGRSEPYGVHDCTKKYKNMRPMCEMPMSPAPDTIKELNWITTGSDSFVSFHELGPMCWGEAKSVCERRGLAFYEPKDALAVAKALHEQVPKPENMNLYYWVGAQGNGEAPQWLSGDEVPSSAPWTDGSYTYNKAKAVGRCVWLGVISGYFSLGSNYCSNKVYNKLYNHALCGVVG